MDLAFELPIKHLKELGAHNDYHFTLAHLIGNEEYLTHYRESNNYTICDNSAFELNTPLSAPEVVNAASLLRAQEIIAPDSFGSGKGTIQATTDFIKYLDGEGYLGKFRIMGVVQGANVPDWINCLLHMRDNKHIDVIGFSYVGCKHFASDLANARIGAVNVAVHENHGNLKKPIHLLGMGSNPTELLAQRNVPTIRSCDTSLPVVQGLYKNKLHPSTGLVGPKLSRPDDYFNTTADKEQMDSIVHNINIMKQWVSTANV